MVKKICKYCHKEFVTNYNPKMFCTDYCARQFHRSGAKQTEFVCEYCGKTFTWDRKKKYCSIDCQYRASSNSKKMGSTKKRPKPKNFMSIEEVAKASMEMNMSAGEYMAKFCYGKE